MEFSRSKEDIFVNPHKYVLNLIGETSLLGCKATKTFIEPNLNLHSTKTKNVVNKEQYQRLVGRLIYLSHTCSNIVFSISMVSQFMHSLGLEHFDVVYRILRYLKVTHGRGLLFKKHAQLQIKVYTNAN